MSHFYRVTLVAIVAVVVALATGTGWTFADGPVSGLSAAKALVWSDAEIRTRLTTEGDRLKAAGKATAADELAKQLTRKQAAVQLPPADGKPLPPDRLYDAASRVTVVFSSLYKCDKCEHTHANAASGVILSPDGLVATNYHVIAKKDAFAFVAMTADGTVYPVVEVLAGDATRDVALVRLGGAKNLPHAAVRADSKPLTDVVVMSHPDSRFFSITKGVVSRYFRRGRDGKGPVFMQITADYARGSSGGPVLNTAGELVGIVSSTMSVYYSTDKGVQQNLQMVFKDCVPAEAILDLVDGTDPK